MSFTLTRCNEQKKRWHVTGELWITTASTRSVTSGEETIRAHNIWFCPLLFLENFKEYLQYSKVETRNLSFNSEKMASAQVVETSVTNNSPCQDSNHPDDLFQIKE